MLKAASGERGVEEEGREEKKGGRYSGDGKK